MGHIWFEDDLSMSYNREPTDIRSLSAACTERRISEIEVSGNKKAASSI